MVEVLDKGLQFAVAFVGEQLPVQFLFIVPFDKLAELLSHKQQLFAWMRHHISQHGAHSRKLLAVLAWHLVDQRAFAVDHLVVGQRQHIIFGKCIHHTEGKFVVIVRAIDRVERYVAEHVVHPAHVPLEVEAKPVHIRRFGDQRPCRGLLSDHQHVGVFAQNCTVELFDKLHRLQVLIATMYIRCPLPRFLAVVQIQHRRNRIDAQTVHVEFFHPEHRAGDQEALHLGASEVEDAGAPVRMLALLRVLIFVALGAVKLIQSLFVLWKMGWYPVHDDADVVFVHLIDKVHQVFRCAVARSRCKIAGDLIAPGRVVRVLGDRHQLNVGVAHLLDVDRQLIGQLAIVKKLSVLILTPGADVDLIDVDRFAQVVLQLSFFHPRLILPGIFAQLIKAGS